MSKATTIAIANQKGGVSKTSSTANIGYELARRGHRVLLVDMDGQGSLTYIAGHKYENLAPGDALPALLLPDHVKRGDGELPLPSSLGCDLLPATPEMKAMDKDLLGVEGGNHRLRVALESFVDRYDFILIDSAPQLAASTVNCLIASEYVLVPIRANAISSRGYQQLRETIEKIRKYEPGADPKILGMFATQVKGKTRKAMDVENAFRKMDRAGLGTYLGSVRASVKVEEADDLGKAVREHKPDNKAAIDYANLTTRILEQLNGKEKSDG